MSRMADEAFAKTGIAPSYAFLLMAVNRKPGVQPGELAETMMLSPSTVTRLIEKLEAKGFLVRRQEGKSVFVSPTLSAQELNQDLMTAWQGLYDRYVSVLGEETARQLTTDIFSATEKLDTSD
ncbi:MAG: MarR family transcriptional regulator [Bacteroidetes bacterium]|nr:MarR family transcriptional regulator [Bacteroidota bacterium]